MLLGKPVCSVVKNPAHAGATEKELEDLLEKEMETHSGILAGIIPWTEDPGELQSMGS